MPLLNISQAARASGKDRNTIRKYIKLGVLSSSVDGCGKVLIDAAELVRVFGSLVSDGAKESAESSPEKNRCDDDFNTVEALLQQLKAAEEREKAALEREAWLKKQLELEQERSRELERRMLPPAKGFFARLFGK